MKTAGDSNKRQSADRLAGAHGEQPSAGLKPGRVEGTSPAGGPAKGPSPALTWAVRPCTINPARSASAVAVILSFGFLVLIVVHDVFWAVFSVVVLFASLHNYFLTTRYSLSAEGVEVKGLVGSQRKEWKNFKSFWVDAGGVSLSPFKGRSWLEHYRGVRLLFRGNADQVIDFVKQMLGEELRRG
ncbi:MAG: hypothetical protein V2A71_06175 [Candidatus Eisenbacteria bacterium]